MRSLARWGLVAILLVAAGMAVASSLGDHGLGQVALAGNHKDESGKNNGDRDDDTGDHNRGHGNDDDGFDEDNPGRGNGSKKDKDKPGHGDDQDTPGNDKPVVTVEAYAVEVTCQYDADDGLTTCIFTGVAPSGGKDVSHIDLPAGAVCAEVVDGDYEYVDPDPNTHVTGYKSTGSGAVLTLVLEGEVSTSGTTTFWFKTGDGVFPATGPALRCDAMAADASNEALEQPTATSTDAAETGTVVVETYTCIDVPEDRSAFDWFGMCEPGGVPVTFELTPVDAATGVPQMMETDGNGEATFEALTPGNYELDAVDALWCHANSDNVTSQSEVVVEPGASTTVWIFVCDDGKDGV